MAVRVSNHLVLLGQCHTLTQTKVTRALLHPLAVGCVRQVILSLGWSASPPLITGTYTPLYPQASLLSTYMIIIIDL